MDKKGKHAGRPQKTSKHQDRKIQAICLENRKCTTKQTNRCIEKGVSVMYYIVLISIISQLYMIYTKHSFVQVY